MSLTAQQVREEAPLSLQDEAPLEEPSIPDRKVPRKRRRNPPITRRTQIRWTIFRLNEMSYDAIARKDDHDYCAATVKRAVHKFSLSLGIQLPEWRKWRHK